MTPITNSDLYKNSYDYKTLKANIYAVCLLDIVKTQKLTEEFCAKYILNDDFKLSDEDNLITIQLIKKYQPHINQHMLTKELTKINIKKMLGERTNSFDDFEKI